MRPIRLIALDLDGTLLRSDKTVSPYARSVLERLRGHEKRPRGKKLYSRAMDLRIRNRAVSHYVKIKERRS